MRRCNLMLCVGFGVLAAFLVTGMIQLVVSQQFVHETVSQQERYFVDGGDAWDDGGRVFDDNGRNTYHDTEAPRRGKGHVKETRWEVVLAVGAFLALCCVSLCVVLPMQIREDRARRLAIRRAKAAAGCARSHSPNVVATSPTTPGCPCCE